MSPDSPPSSPPVPVPAPPELPPAGALPWAAVLVGAYASGVLVHAAFSPGRLSPAGLVQVLGASPWVAWGVAVALVATVAAALAPGVGSAQRGDAAAAVRAWAVAAVATLVLVLLASVDPRSSHAAHLLLPAAGAVLALPVAAGLARAPGGLDRLLTHRAVPWVVGLLCAGWYFTVSYLRHAWFGSGSKDMGLFLQSVWLLSRFSSPQNTVMGMHAFADHMEWVDVLVAPLLWLWSDAGMLLLVQAVSAGLGAVPVFRLARDRLGSPLAGLLAAGAYFLAAEISQGVQFDWNPTTVSLGLFPWAFEAAVAQRWRRMAVFLVLVGLCKENLLLYVGGFGVMLAFWRAPRRVWLATVLVPAVAFVVEIKLLFPLFREGGFRHFYFQDLGTDFGDAALNMLKSPGRVLALLFNPAQKVDGLLLPLSSTAFLMVLAPETLLPLLPGVLERFGSTFSNSWWGHHYGGPSHALAVCGAVLGASRLAGWLQQRPSVHPADLLRRAVGLWPAAVMLAATALASSMGPWGPVDLFQLHKPYHPDEADRRTMQAAVESVPAGVPVAAQNYLLAHLADRRQVYLLENARQADYVAMTPTTNPWPYDRGYHERLAGELLRDGWHVHFCQGNSFVLARTPGPSVPCPVLGR